ncbi:MAG: malonyl-CoA decarboxylase [Burkholderiaceae bacterium]
MTALFHDCQVLMSERGEANSVVIGRQLIEHLSKLTEEQLLEFFKRLALDFSPHPAQVLAAAQSYFEQSSPANLKRLLQTTEPPRLELFRRINRTPGGTAAMVAMRSTLLKQLRAHPELQVLENDLLHVFTSWFNPGFLEMQKVDWDSPARLLEKLIQHEAVHEIDGWDDLRRRLAPDRRCFAFFHPQLPGEPLIFVEVALLPEMPAAIAPLIDKKSESLLPAQFKVATFYSISNCETGLRGVSLGNFLIKRVAEQLKLELPQIKTFCTISPIPGFSAWLLATTDFRHLHGQRRGLGLRLSKARELLLLNCNGDLSSLAQISVLRSLAPELQQALQRLCSAYLAHQSVASGADPVARFHLDNGARLERINPQADLSKKGMKQSFSTMVNYLYDLEQIETNHEKFIHGEVVYAKSVDKLL